ncbi:hypothetical protein FOL46_007536, partial [Perkinsus olseni]
MVDSEVILKFHFNSDIVRVRASPCDCDSISKLNEYVADAWPELRGKPFDILFCDGLGAKDILDEDKLMKLLSDASGSDGASRNIGLFVEERGVADEGKEADDEQQKSHATTTCGGEACKCSGGEACKCPAMKFHGMMGSSCPAMNKCPYMAAKEGCCCPAMNKCPYMAAKEGCCCPAMNECPYMKCHGMMGCCCPAMNKCPYMAAKEGCCCPAMN